MSQTHTPSRPAKKVSRLYRLPADLVQWLDQAADAYKVDRTALVVRAISELRDRIKPPSVYRSDWKQS